jgi:hypothetical protein
MKAQILVLLMLVATVGSTQESGDAIIRAVEATAGPLQGEGVSAYRLWSFTVTLEHPDTGWEDYADGWDIFLPDGSLLVANPDDKHTRVLWHPHVNEQPFTRGQRGLLIPADVKEVVVRGHDNVQGHGPEFYFVLPID